ncbi:MAG: hypothetical protein ACOYD4_12545 [Solirubrobacterales bacterium]
MEIHSSARKHGVDDEDIEHAIDHAMTNTRLYLGPARSAELLEVVIGNCSREIDDGKEDPRQDRQRQADHR